MPDVYKGKPYMTEDYFENREIGNDGAAISGEEWVKSAKEVAMRDKDLLKEVFKELESDHHDLH